MLAEIKTYRMMLKVDGITGVTKDPMPVYDGLCHGMYRFNGRIYRWSKACSSVHAVNHAYRVCRIIKIKADQRHLGSDTPRRAVIGEIPYCVASPA